MAAMPAGHSSNGGAAEVAGVPDNRFLGRGRSAPGGYGIDVSKLGGDDSEAESPRSSRVSFEQNNAGPFSERSVSSRRSSAVKGDAPLKKKSWMNWKPLRAIAQIGTSKSSCVFSLTLHYIENLPANYNGRRIAVNWMRKENYVDSKPATVSDGFADFEEILHLKCTMYGGKGGTKYLPKSSTLSVQAVDGDRAILGRHKLDLSRLLPSGDIIDRRGSGGGGLDGSTVSFPLSVGSLLVTFGYKVVDAPELNRTWTGTEMVAPRTGANRFAVSKSQKMLNYQPPSPKPPEAPVHPEPIPEVMPSPRKETRDSGTSPEAAAAEAREMGTSPEAEEMAVKDEEAVEKKVLGEGEKGEEEKEEEAAAALDGGEATEEEAGAEKGGEAVVEDETDVAGDAPPHERTGSDADEAEFLQLLGTKSDEFKEAEDTDFDARSDVVQLSRPGSPRGNLAGGFEQNDSQPPTPKTALLRQFEAEMGMFGGEEKQGGMFEDLVDDEGVAYDGDGEYRQKTLGGDEFGADGLGGRVQERMDFDKGGYRLVHRPRYVLDDNGQWVVAGYEEEYERVDAEDGELYVEASNQDFGRTDYELMDDRPMTGEELWEAYRSQEGFHAALRRRNDDMEVGLGEDLPSLSAEYLASQDAPPLRKTSKSRVEELEAAETELLMQQFGLTQDAFDDSPTPPQNPMQRHLSRVVSMQADAMSLAHASGNSLAPPPATALNSGGPSVVALGDGGCLRAMDMRLFPKGSSGLVMQCSQPVVVPPEMGGNAVEIMQRMAGAGADGMIAGALASMPMAELTGMSIDQIAAEGMAALEGSHKKGWASLLDSGAAHRAVNYSSQSLEGGQSALHLEGGNAPLALEYEGSSQQTGQLVTAGRPGFAGYSSNFAELEADRKALTVFESNLPESLSDEARALAIRDVKTELAMRRESRARRQAREIALRNQGGLAGGDRPLAPGELPEQLVGLEELGPLAMQTVESLAIEGLKIQTDMTEQEAPYQVDALSWGDVDPKFIEQAKRQAQAGQLPMMGGPQQFQMLEGGEYVSTSEGGGAMVPLGGPLGGLFSGRNTDMEVNSEDYEANMALMASAVSLDEWMRLDTGVEQDEENMSEQTRAILAAHRAQHGDVAAARARPGGPQQGNMGDKLTLAMLVQLRDPLRNYEPVGQPMLAMVQAERVLSAAAPRRTKRQARLEAAKKRTLQLEGGQQRRAIMGPEEGGRTEEEERRIQEEERRAQQEAVDNAVQEEAEVFYSDDEEMEDTPPPPAETNPKFRITGVHMAGLGKNDKPDAAASKHKKWGGQKQQVAGSRWLLANGLGHNAKSAMMKDKAPPAKTRVKKGETLWSISSRVYGDGSKWKDVAALNPHIRNPDVIFADDTIRMR